MSTRTKFKLILGLFVITVLLLLGFQHVHEKVQALDTEIGSGILVYGVLGNTTGQSRTFNGLSNTFGSQASTTLSSAGTNYAMRTSPTKQEAIVVYGNTSGIIQVMCYDGTTWSNEWTASVGGTGLTRRYDIGYESSTGNVVVLWSTGSTATNALDFRTKSGSTGCGTANWAATTTMPTGTSVTTGAVGWVKIAESPVSTSTLMAAMWSDANTLLGGAIWNGTTFTNFKQIDTTLDRVAAAQDVDNFDIKYSSLSQDIMAAWGSKNTNRSRYIRCTGGTSSCTWGASTTLPVVSATTGADNVVLAANPSTDQILYSSMSSTTSALQNQIWSGTAWATTCTGCSNVDTTTALVTAGTHLVSNAWLVSGTTTRGVVVYNDSATTNIGWYIFSGTSTFTAQTDFTPGAAFGNPQKWYDLQADPFNPDRLMFTLSDRNFDLWGKRLVMGATTTPVLVWSNSDASTALQANLTKASSSPFQFRYWRYIPLPTFTQIAYRIFNDAASTDVGSALAAQDTAVTLATTGAVFRVRALVQVGVNELMKSYKQFRLQYVAKGSGTCAAPSGGTPSTYTDVSTSTLIAYYNGAGTNGAALTNNANDPTHGGDSISNQTFNESNPVSNAVATTSSGADAKWDFSLKDNNASSSTAYCLRMVGLTTPLYSWGNAAYNNNALAQNYSATGTVSTPTPIFYPNMNWLKITGGGGFVAAVRSDGTLWGWGQSSGGQGAPFGVGDTGTRVIPVQVGATSTWVDVFAGIYSTIALQSDGTLWGTGDNFYGELGLGVATNTTILTFNKIGTATNWAYAAPSLFHTLALRTDGSLWVWGTNFHGELGTGGATSSVVVTPTQLGSDTWIDIAVRANTSFGIKSNGTLWLWGENNAAFNYYGSATTTANFLSPIQIGTDTDWVKLRKGLCSAMFAIKTNGTLWMWGLNTSGQAGNGATSTSQVALTQVGSATNWQSVSCAGPGAFGIKTDGTAWAWGDMTYAVTGNGISSTTPQMTPAQIGASTTWTALASPNFWSGFFGIQTNSNVLDTYSSLPQITTAGGTQSISFAISTTTIYLGTLTSSATSYGSSTNTSGSSVEVQAHTLAVNTNASTGYTLTVQGGGLQSTENSAWTIAPLAVSTAPSIGTEQFGIRAVVSGGTGTTTSPYNSSGFAYTATATTSAVIGTESVGDSATSTYSMRYMVNISPTTDASTYTGNFVYVATANF